MPAHEMPAHATSFTPEHERAQHAAQRAHLYSQIDSLIKQNAAITEPFCTDPRSHVVLSVDPSNYRHIFTHQYAIAAALRDSVTEILARWLQMGRITVAPTNCRFNSPLLPVPKKDEQGRMTGVRLCIDVRNLNKHLKENDRFLLPHIPDILAKFAGHQLFGEYDLSEAYFQFRLTDESQQYTAFTWDKKQYMCVGCPYGIKHIPSLFQRFMCDLFSDMPFVFPYIDNIAFASHTWEQHQLHAAAIIERLNSVNLKIKPSSINVGNTCLKLLGHVISTSGISVDPEKQQMIMDWPEPVSGDILASALGLGAYLHDHIRHYADITAPLEEVKKQKVIQWNDNLRAHWQLFKRAFSNAPILRFPDFNKRFVLATDASNTGIGGVLYQPDDDNNTITSTNIVAITSKKLDATQRNYPVYKKELFGVIHSLRKFHTYVWGRNDVLVLTDHRPLIHILGQKNLSVALQQWLDVLLNYDLDIKYRPGLLHVVPDAISRMYTGAYADPATTWGTHDNIRLLTALGDITTHTSPSDAACQQSIDDIKTSAVARKRHDTTFVCTLASASSNDMHVETEEDTIDDTSLDDNEYMLTHSDTQHSDEPHTELVIAPMTAEQRQQHEQERRNKTTPPAAERAALLEAAHNHGHMGYTAIYARLSAAGWWWPNMKDDILTALKSCELCQKYTTVKSGYHPSRPVTALLPGDHYQIDLAQFPTSPEGQKYCLVLVDVFTGFIILRALPNKEDITVARALFDIFAIIGIPRILQSDNGGEFQNKILHALTHSLGIDRRFIAAYNPRADGKVERVLGTIKRTIMKLMRGANIFWPYHLSYVQYAYNDKIHSITGSTPFALMFGRQTNMPINYNTDNDDTHYTSTGIDAWKQHQTQVVSLIYPAINQRVTQKQKAYIDKLNTTRRIITESLAAGTRIMLKDPLYILDKSIKPGHEPTYMGAYTIVRRLPTGPYIVQDDEGVQLDRPIPLDQMRVLFPPKSSSSSSSSSHHHHHHLHHQFRPNKPIQLKIL